MHLFAKCRYLNVVIFFVLDFLTWSTRRWCSSPLGYGYLFLINWQTCINVIICEFITMSAWQWDIWHPILLGHPVSRKRQMVFSRKRMEKCFAGIVRVQSIFLLVLIIRTLWAKIWLPGPRCNVTDELYLLKV